MFLLKCTECTVFSYTRKQWMYNFGIFKSPKLSTCPDKHVLLWTIQWKPVRKPAQSERLSAQQLLLSRVLCRRRYCAETCSLFPSAPVSLLHTVVSKRHFIYCTAKILCWNNCLFFFRERLEWSVAVTEYRFGYIQKISAVKIQLSVESERVSLLCI